MAVECGGINFVAIDSRPRALAYQYTQDRSTYDGARLTSVDRRTCINGIAIDWNPRRKQHSQYRNALATRTSSSRRLTVKLRLKVNESKSAVARPVERQFLGFTNTNDGSERRIATKAL